MKLTQVFRDSYSPFLVHGQRRDCCGCSENIKREGGRFSLEDAPVSHVLLDVDKFSEHNPSAGKTPPSCDFAFAANEARDRHAIIAVVEVTSGEKSRSRVKKQLQAGADIVAKTLPSACKGTSVKFHAILVGKMSGTRKENRQNPIEVMYCGKGSNVRIVSSKGRKLADELDCRR